MVDALVSYVADNLLNLARDEALLLTGLKSKLQDLSHELRTIRAVLQDAEMKQIRDEAIRVWLQNLKYVAYEIEDMVEEWDQVSNFSSPFSCMMHPVRQHKFGHRVNAIIEKLAKISSEKDRYHFCEIPVKEMEERQTSSFVEQSSIIGRDGYKEILIKKLLEDDVLCRKDKVPTISIVGMGGLGKTTLAQFVFNSPLIKRHFEKCIWVCVSNDFNAKDIMINVVKNGGGYVYKLDGDQVEFIQRKLVEVLGNKRFLLILDDVWNEDELIWEPLQSILSCGAEGSRIVVTTRIRGVAHALRSEYIHDLGLLSKDECWSIFKRIVFEEDDENQRYKDLEDVGKQIVDKCGGIPLAVKTIASAIRKKVKGKKAVRKHLESMLNNDLWNVSDSNVGILPALMLSYIELPPKLKNCFCYCSLFEKDTLLQKDLLTKLWVAQGYVASRDEHMEVEYIAEEYFNELLERSLLQEPKEDEHGAVVSCKMHDLVHDLAKWVTKTEFSAIKVIHSKNELSLVNVRHCTILEKIDLEADVDLTGVENLRTLMYLTGYQYFDMSIGIIKQLQSVRVLSLRRARIEEVPIRKLVHLRYLNLSRTKIELLPKSIGKLKELIYLDLSDTLVKGLPSTITSLSRLQTLKLSRCYYLNKLPNGFSKMVCLRHLDVARCWKLKKLSDGIGRLNLLKTLGMFPVASMTRTSSNIRDLECLNSLHGSLSIYNLGAVLSREEACSAKLEDKISLASLSLYWKPEDGDEHDNVVRSIRVLEGLLPPPELEKLCIYYYPSEKFPSWIGGAAFLLHLRELRLWNCSNCTELPPLGQLPCLRSIDIKDLPMVKKVGVEFLHRVAFPQLERISFYRMENWELWTSQAGKPVNEDGIKTPNSMSQLCYIGLSNCPKLEEVPPIFATTTLRSVLIVNAPMLRSLQFLPSTIEYLLLALVSTWKLLVKCPNLPYLKHLEIRDDWELTELPSSLPVLSNLQSLEISRCQNLRWLPEELMQMTQLQKLQIYECPEVRESCQRGGCLWPRISHIPYIRIDDKTIQD